MGHKKTIAIFVLIPLLFLMISTSLIFVIFSSEVGYVAEKSENQIWLVEERKDIERVKYEKAHEVGGVYFETKYMPSFIEEKVEEGNKIEVFSIGRVQTSSPEKAKAVFFVILAK